MSNKAVTVNLLCFGETPNSYHVGFQESDRESEESFFLPISQVKRDILAVKRGIETCEFTIPLWLAEKKPQLRLLAEEAEEEDDDYDVFE